MSINEELLQQTREIMEFQLGRDVLTDEVIQFMQLMMEWAWMYEKYRDEIIENAAAELEHGLLSLISRIKYDS